MILNWRYDREDVFKRAIWFRNSVLIMTMTGTEPAKPAAGVTNIQHISNGAIKIEAWSLADVGEYGLTVQYEFSSSVLTAGDSVTVSFLGKLF